jgi:hypothetical protein
MAEMGTANVVTTKTFGLNLEKILQEQSTDEILVIVVKCLVFHLYQQVAFVTLVVTSLRDVCYLDVDTKKILKETPWPE